MICSFLQRESNKPKRRSYEKTKYTAKCYEYKGILASGAAWGIWYGCVGSKAGFGLYTKGILWELWYEWDSSDADFSLYAGYRGLRQVSSSGVIQRKITVGKKIWELSKLVGYIYCQIVARRNLVGVKREDVRIVLKGVLDGRKFDDDDALCTAIEKIILLDKEKKVLAPEKKELAPKEQVAPIELPEPYTEPLKQRTDTAADTADQLPEPYTEPVNPIPGCYFFMPHVTGALVLYRSMSEEEYIELLSTIDTEKKALFKHKKKEARRSFLLRILSIWLET